MDNKREEYQKLLFARDYDKANKLRLQMLDDREYFLYKYYSCEEYNIEAIKQNKIWFAMPESFNDPFEFKFSLKSKELEIPDDIKKVIGEDFFTDVRKKIEKMRSSQLLNGFSVCCFTESYDDELMWSYYNKHHGFCVRYRVKNYFKDSIYPVCYVDKVCDLTMNNKELHDLNEELINICLTSKWNVWSHENEWRCIHNGIDAGLNAGPEICDIYLGAKIESNDEQLIKSAIEGKSIHLHHMSMEDCKYKLVCKD